MTAQRCLMYAAICVAVVLSACSADYHDAEATVQGSSPATAHEGTDGGVTMTGSAPSGTAAPGASPPKTAPGASPPTTTAKASPTTTVPEVSPSTTLPAPGDETPSTASPMPWSDGPARRDGRDAGVGDDLYPWLGNPGYDVQHYDITLALDTSEAAIESPMPIDANARISAVATAAQGLDAFHLDLLGLDIASISVDAEPATWQRHGAELVVTPAVPISTGAEFVIEIAYSGTPTTVTDPGVSFLDLGWNAGNGEIYVVAEPSGAMTWYPSNNHPTDKATFTFNVTVPEHLTVAATGVLVDEKVADGRRTSVWEMNHPMATYLAAVYIGEFARYEQDPYGDVVLRDYLPASLSDEQRDSMLEQLARTRDIIAYFERIFGPYPFDAYGTMVMSQQIGFALENQTLSVHDPRTVRPDYLAHEIFHQWIGNAVTAGEWSHTWLHEGFATYLTFMYLDHAGLIDLGETMADELREAIAADAAAPGRATHELMFDYQAMYRRGALTLHALRSVTGDEAFLEILRRFYEDHLHGTAVTADFAALVADVGGAPAIEVLISWLYDIDMPDTFGR